MGAGKGHHMHGKRQAEEGFIPHMDVLRIRVEHEGWRGEAMQQDHRVKLRVTICRQGKCFFKLPLSYFHLFTSCRCSITAADRRLIVSVCRFTTASLAENKRLTAGVQEPAVAAENTNGSE